MNIRNDNFKHHLQYVGFISMLFSLCLMSCNKANKTYDVKSYRTCMNFHDDFKILQITDTHLGFEVDLNHEMNIVTNYMLEADPDLVIFTGDNFTYASKGIVKEFIKRVNDTCLYLTNSHVDRLTKFALTYGNHDNQGDFPRYFINHVIKEYATIDGKEKQDNKFAAFIDFDDDNIYGLTNYYIDLVDDISKPNETVDVIYRLHIIDSNTYHFNGVKYKYDCIHDDQLDHVLNVYNNATTDKDYIGTLATGSVKLDAPGAKATDKEKYQKKIDEVKAKLESGELHVFDTDTFTVSTFGDGKNTFFNLNATVDPLTHKVTGYMADVDSDPAYAGDTEAIKDGYFHESEYRSAPYFDLIIDGVIIVEEQK